MISFIQSHHQFAILTPFQIAYMIAKNYVFSFFHIVVARQANNNNCY